MSEATRARRLVAEALGTGVLVATIVGSGIMASKLTTDFGLMLLGNTIPTGAILVVLILIYYALPFVGIRLSSWTSAVLAFSLVLASRSARVTPARRI